MGVYGIIYLGGVQMNKVILVGNLTADPEVQDKSGKKVLKFTVAVDTYNGTEFIDCTAFDKLAQAMGDNLNKGSKVLVEGHLSVDKWVDKDGQNRKKLDIIADSVEFLSPKRVQQQEEEMSL